MSKGKTVKGTAIKQIEMRRCAACRQVRHKSELLRFVKTDSGGNVTLHPVDALEGHDNSSIITAPKSEYVVMLDEPKKIFSRGAYVCKSSECLALLKKRRSLEKIFKVKVPDELYDKVKETVLM